MELEVKILKALGAVLSTYSLPQNPLEGSVTTRIAVPTPRDSVVLGGSLAQRVLLLRVWDHTLRSSAFENTFSSSPSITGCLG